MKVLGVVLDRRLTFEKHVTMVARSCHYHAQAIRHIRHLLSTEMALTLARSLILTRLDYCNSLLHGSHTSSIQTLQRVQNNAARIVLQAPRQCHANPLLRQPQWMPVRHRIKYKLAVMTYNIHSTGLPAYLSHHINPCETTRTLRSSDTLLFTVPFTRTELAKRAFRCAAPSVWNSLPSFIINSGCMTTFKSRLRTYFFRLSFDCSVHV